MKVVVGLGNTGARYEKTRHNLGFRVADELSRNLECSRIPAAGVPGTLARGTVKTPGGEEPVVILQPATFMNASGRAVAALHRATDGAFGPGDVLVVLDDIYLDFGRLRLRGSGSAGGHNGLKSVLGVLGTTEVPRLRCGVGPAPEAEDLVEWVLEEFSGEEEEALPAFIERAASAARICLEEGLSTAMNRCNA